MSVEEVIRRLTDPNWTPPPPTWRWDWATMTAVKL